MLLFCLLHPGATAIAESDERPRARDIGLAVGTFKTGPLNAITDVRHVRVGHATRIEGDDIRTGVTAIIPGPGNLYTHPIPAWIHVGNGYGKLIGETQVREFGEIETPILLTCTLCVWSAANALKEWMYQQPGMGEHTLNPVVGETNDSRVNNMWADPVGKTEVFAALDNAAGGPVAEGSVGAGTGTQAFAWKGGIGTSSRVLPPIWFSCLIRRLKSGQSLAKLPTIRTQTLVLEDTLTGTATEAVITRVPTTRCRVLKLRSLLWKKER
jgi:D-aminopeptidase